MTDDLARATSDLQAAIKARQSYAELLRLTERLRAENANLRRHLAERARWGK